MTECEICLEKFPRDVFQFLPCAHFMCKFCFEKLKKLECPYCKHSFSEEITEEEEQYLTENLEIPDEPNLRKKKKRKNKKKKNFMFNFLSEPASSSRSSFYNGFQELRLDD